MDKRQKGLTDPLQEKINRTRQETEKLKQDLENLIRSNIRHPLENAAPIPKLTDNKQSSSSLMPTKIDEFASITKMQILRSYDHQKTVPKFTPADVGGTGSQMSPDKPKPYDVEKAREYIRKQKEKRLLELKSKKKESTVTADMKKEKLKALQKKSLELVAKNVKLSRERSKSREPPIQRSRSASREPKVDLNTALISGTSRSKSANNRAVNKEEVQHVNGDLEKISARYASSSENSKKSVNTRESRARNNPNLLQIPRLNYVGNQKPDKENNIPKTNVLNDIHSINIVTNVDIGVNHKKIEKLECNNLGIAQENLSVESRNGISNINSNSNDKIINETEKGKISIISNVLIEPKPYAMWLKETSPQADPYNIINTVNRQLKYITDQPKTTLVDVGIQNSLSNEKSIKKSQKYSEHSGSDTSKNIPSIVSEFTNIHSDNLNVINRPSSVKNLEIPQISLNSTDKTKKSAMITSEVYTTDFSEETDKKSRNSVKKNLFQDDDLDLDNVERLNKSRESIIAFNRASPNISPNIKKVEEKNKNFSKDENVTPKNSREMYINTRRRSEINKIDTNFDDAFIDTLSFENLGSKNNLKSQNTIVTESVVDTLDTAFQKSSSQESQEFVSLFSTLRPSTEDNEHQEVILEESNKFKTAVLDLVAPRANLKVKKTLTSKDKKMLLKNSVSLSSNRSDGSVNEMSDISTASKLSMESLKSKNKEIQVTSENSFKEIWKAKTRLRNQNSESSVEEIVSDYTKSSKKSNQGNLERKDILSDASYEEILSDYSKASRSSKKEIINLKSEQNVLKPPIHISAIKSESNLKNGTSKFETEPKLTLKMSKNQRELDKRDLIKNVSMRSYPIDKDRSRPDLNASQNEIHLKFEAEIHLLNDFNQSLRQFWEIEKEFNSLRSRNESKKTIQDRDTQTSIISKASSKHLEIEPVNSKSQLSFINFSRGSGTNGDPTLNDHSTEDLSELPSAIIPTESFKDDTINSIVSVKDNSLSCWSNMEAVNNVMKNDNVATVSLALELNSLRSKNEFQKAIQNKDTQTSIISRAGSNNFEIEPNASKSQLSFINFSRGSGTNMDLILNDHSTEDVSDLESAILTTESFKDDTINSVVSVKENSVSCLSHMEPVKDNFNLNSVATVSLALFDQLIKDEDARLENLKINLKIRKQALLDRTKVELFSLEAQKRKLQKNLQLEAASDVKKRQRGILLRLQQEQHEIQRLKQMQKEASEKRKNEIKQQKKLIKHRLHSDNMLSKLKLTNHRDRRRSTEPFKVIQTTRTVSGSIRSETSMIDKQGGMTSDNEIRTITTSRTHSTVNILSEISDNNAALTNERPELEMNARNRDTLGAVAIGDLRRTLLMRQQALDKRRKAAEELLQWHKKLVEEEKAIVNLEKSAKNIIFQTPSVPNLTRNKRITNLKRNLSENDVKTIPQDVVFERINSNLKTYSSQTSSVPSQVSLTANTSNNNQYTTDFEPESPKDAVDESRITSISALIDNFSKIQEEISVIHTEKSIEEIEDQVDNLKSTNVDTKSQNLHTQNSEEIVTKASSQIEEINSLLEYTQIPPSEKLISAINFEKHTNKDVLNDKEASDTLAFVKTSSEIPDEDISEKISFKDTIFSDNIASEHQILEHDQPKSLTAIIESIKSTLNSENIERLTEDGKNETISEKIHSEVNDNENEVILDTEYLDDINKVPSVEEDVSKIESDEIIVVASVPSTKEDTENINESLNVSIEEPEEHVTKPFEHEVEIEEIVTENDNTLTKIIESDKYIKELQEETIPFLEELNLDLQDTQNTSISSDQESGTSKQIEDLTEDVVSPLSKEARTSFIEEKDHDSLSSESASESQKVKTIVLVEEKSLENKTDEEKAASILNLNQTEPEPRRFTLSEEYAAQLNASNVNISSNKNVPYIEETSEKSDTSSSSSINTEKTESGEGSARTSDIFKNEESSKSSENSPKFVDLPPKSPKKFLKTCSTEARSPRMLEERSPRGNVDVKKRVLEILEETSPLAKGDRNTRLQELCVMTYDLASPVGFPEAGSSKESLGNEAQELLRKQLAIEQEIKLLTAQQQKELSQPSFVREIPNKPPPPYKPPASKSPKKTTIDTVIPKSREIEEIATYSAKIIHKAYLTNNLLNIGISDNTLNLIAKDIHKDCFKFVFDLCKEIAIEHYSKFEKQEGPSWLNLETLSLPITKPLDVQDLEKLLKQKLLETFGYLKPLGRQSAILNWSTRKLKDKGDVAVIHEIHVEESTWNNFEKEEVLVKNKVFNQVFDTLMQEAINDYMKAFAAKHSNLNNQ